MWCRESRSLGTKLKLKNVEFWAFKDPSVQNQLYHTPLLFKRWDLTENKKLWTIPWKANKLWRRSYVTKFDICSLQHPPCTNNVLSEEWNNADSAQIDCQPLLHLPNTLNKGQKYKLQSDPDRFFMRLDIYERFIFGFIQKTTIHIKIWIVHITTNLPVSGSHNQ